MNEEPTYSEQLTKRILSRAVEIDHIRSQNYSLTDLRNIAVEVGVSEAALDQAMRELHPAPRVQDTPSAARARAWFLIPAVAAGAALLGLAGGIVDARTIYITSPLVMSVLLMFSGGLAVT